MDRLTLIQLDRIENKINQIGILMDEFNADTNRELLLQWYEEEVIAEEGQLHHMFSDKILANYMAEISEEEYENEVLGTEDVNEPFPVETSDSEYRQPTKKEDNYKQ